MTRLALLLSGCSAFLVATWLVAGNHEASLRTPNVPPHGDPLPFQQETKRDLSLNGPYPEAHDNNGGKHGLQTKKGTPRRKAPMKGVMVDRTNIREGVTLDDLQAPDGRLWIPAAIAGPIDKRLADPLFNVLVAYCQLDMASYHETPWLFAMGTFHQRHSGCLDDKSLVRTYRLSDLVRLVEENPDDFMDPSGFIYHETRCGSTLSANMMAAVPTNIVHSETPPPIAVLNLCAGPGKCPAGMRERLVHTVFRLMGPVQQGHTHSFFKFQSSKFVEAVETAWPDVKWIYLFRDPLEVIASNLKGAWRKAGVKKPTVGNATAPMYNLGGPCVRAVKGIKVPGAKSKPPSPDMLVNACAKQLESLNEVALKQIQGGSPNGLAVEYRQLPEVITEYVYPVHFGMADTEKEREEYKGWMEPVTHVYSKGMATPLEGAVSKEYKQGMDLELKQEGSDEAMRAAASTMCDNYLRLVDLQQWHKVAEGSTMGTCTR